MFKLFHFLKPYKIALIGVFLLTFLQTLGTLNIPTLTAEIVNHGIAKGDISNIVKIG